MDKKLASRIINVCMGQDRADLRIDNARVIDVFNKEVFEASVAVVDGFIASFDSSIDAKEVYDAGGRYLVPGLIDAHCHIESSHLSPAAYSDLVVPCGTTTVIADPHEICNVAGKDAMRYMLEASEGLPLSVFLMFPSCVPATDSEHAGAVLLAEDALEFLDEDRVLGLGEMMNYPGVAACSPVVMDKLDAAYRHHGFIDGHAPAVAGAGLDAYSACQIKTDHECSTPAELHERVRRGMFVALREGTACRNVLDLLPGVGRGARSRVMFCTDDCQPESIIDLGHIQHAINLAIGAGMDPIDAVSAATLNASTCYHLEDRGAIAPGRRADFFLCSSLDEISPDEVWTAGILRSKSGRMLTKAKHVRPEKVEGMMDVKDFSAARLALPLKSDKARVIGIIPGGVVTKNLVLPVKRGKDGCFESSDDILKIASVERHKGTGNVGVGLIQGYGLKTGAIATSISHDSHNIIVIGANDADMAVAVEHLASIGGGITIVKDGKVLITQRLEIAGLMTDRTGDEVYKELGEMHRVAYDELGVNREIDPFMTLSFMALPVIPSLKITDSGLFDVDSFCFTSIDPE